MSLFLTVLDDHLQEESRNELMNITNTSLYYTGLYLKSQGWFFYSSLLKVMLYSICSWHYPQPPDLTHKICIKKIYKDINLAILALQQDKSKKAAYLTVHTIIISIFFNGPKINRRKFYYCCKTKMDKFRPS